MLLGNVPADWKAYAPIPVVIVLHDERSSADAEANPAAFPPPLALQLLTLALPNFPSFGYPPRPSPPPTFLLVVPEALSLGRFEGDGGGGDAVDGNLAGMDHCGWNSGHRGFDGRTLGVDDVGFVDALLTHLQEVFTGDLLRVNPYGTGATEGLDLSRVYVAGTGNGGEMAYRLACELPAQPGGHSVRALAVIGGTVGGWWDSTDQVTEVVNNPWATMPEPPDVLIVHGMLDTDIAPYPPYEPFPSDAEAKRMLAEVSDGLADTATPSDYGFEFSRNLWVTYLQFQLPLVTPSPSEVTVDLPVLPLPLHLPPVTTHTVRVRQYRFEDPAIPGSPRAPRERFLTTVLDDALAHARPTWDLGKLTWDSFTVPRSLVP